MPEIKRCGSCGRFLSTDEFCFRNRKKAIRSAVCRKCRSVSDYIWRRQNIERKKEMDRRYYITNKERITEYKRQYYSDEDNIKHCREQKRKHYRDNKEVYKNRASLHKKNNKEKVKFWKEKRRTKKRNQFLKLTKEERNRIEILYKWQQELPGDWHVDHIVPVNRGGLTHPDNMQLIPAEQNLKKSNKDPKEFYGRFCEFLTGHQ